MDMRIMNAILISILHGMETKEDIVGIVTIDAQVVVIALVETTTNIVHNDLRRAYLGKRYLLFLRIQQRLLDLNPVVVPYWVLAEISILSKLCRVGGTSRQANLKGGYPCPAN